MPGRSTLIDPKKKERFAVLVGLGCTIPEASTACGFSLRTGDTLIAQPESARSRTRRGAGRG